MIGDGMQWLDIAIPSPRARDRHPRRLDPGRASRKMAAAILALAIEAEWRKRAAGVVPAQPKARPEGQRHILFCIAGARGSAFADKADLRNVRRNGFSCPNSNVAILLAPAV